MNNSTFDLLCEASQLSFSAEDRKAAVAALDTMVAFTGKVRDYDCVYDDTAVPAVGLAELREDNMLPSYPPEKLLENTESLFDCYVIPKLMEE